MENLIIILQIISGSLMIIAILLQQRGAGLGAAFGGDGEVYRTRRGAEKLFFNSTIALAVIFFALGVIRLVI